MSNDGARRGHLAEAPHGLLDHLHDRGSTPHRWAAFGPGRRPPSAIHLLRKTDMRYGVNGSPMAPPVFGRPAEGSDGVHTCDGARLLLHGTKLAPARLEPQGIAPTLGQPLAREQPGRSGSAFAQAAGALVVR